MRWKTAEIAGWGRAIRASVTLARPERQGALRVLAGEGPAIGMRRSYGDAPLNTGGRAIDMTRLDRMLDFDPATGVLEVEAGARIGDIAAALAPRGFLPAVMPGAGLATVGGCIAMDVHGKNHHEAGSFGAHVDAITFATPDGPRRITAMSDPDLFRATLGGLGQTGPILAASLRLRAGAGTAMRVTERRVPDLDDHLAALAAATATHVVGWIDATATGRALGRGIVEAAEMAEGPQGSPSRPGRARRIPVDAPGFALSGPVVRGFNALYWRRVPVSGRTRLRPMSDFFFPLDRIRDWNRLYGARGFHQFQCVLPAGGEPALRAIVETVATSGLASPLAVLKRMGPGRAGHLSFPMDGWTLAVDFPNRPDAAPLIRRLVAMTAGAGGRIYFAKDGLADPDLIPAMYPELDDWRRIVAAADPLGRNVTDLVRRLRLREARA